MEYREFDGERYTRSMRSSGDRFWEREAPPHDLRCDCGSDTFRVHFGEYECIATCSQCGHAEVIYDG